MMTAAQKSVPRLVLYGIGQYGQMMVRLADKKGWPIVAAYNRAGAKVGQDIGRLAGLDRDYGVVVEDCDTADYSKLDADAAIVTLYDTVRENFTAHKRMLEAGLNVVCHGSESYYPQMADPAIAAEVDRIAKANNVSFVGTGVWDMSRIWSGLTAAGVCNKIHSLHNSSLTLLDPFGPRILLMTGVSKSPEWFYENIAQPDSPYGGHFYRFGPALILDALGLTVDNCTHRQEPYILDKPAWCEALGQEIPAGACAGLTAIIEVTTKEGVTATGAMESRIRLSDEDSEHTIWEIKGDLLSPKVRIERDNGHYMHGLSVFNRVTDAIAAEPGIQLISKLGPLRPLSIQ
jgi:4-hydroxy-tetrahydrodipicolinate reductase